MELHGKRNEKMSYPRYRKVRRKRRNPFIPAVLIAFLLVILGAVLFLLQEPVIVLSDQVKFPVGTSVTVRELVLEVQNGVLFNGEESICRTEAGTERAVIQVKNRLGGIYEESVTVTFYEIVIPDTTPPVITAPDSVEILEGQSVDLMQGVSAVDDSGEVCSVAISGEYDPAVPGVYHVFYVAADSAGNVAKKPLTFTVKKLILPFDENGKLVDGTYTTVKGFQIVVEGGMARVEGHVIANKSFALPKTYTSARMTAETSAAYNQMKNAAQADGITLSVKSAYRSWNDQNWIFNDYVRRDGVEKAETYSARPGHSEHQTGMGLDLVTSDSIEARENAAVKAARDWLNQNAYKYGFILRYPEGKTGETGYIYEPWHYRYVGQALASTLYNNGDWITMESYYGFDSMYRGYTN